VGVQVPPSPSVDADALAGASSSDRLQVGAAHTMVAIVAKAAA
jgi:hypothetical protein